MSNHSWVIGPDARDNNHLDQNTCPNDDCGEKLIKVIDEISPDKLKTISHTKYVEQIVETARKSIEFDSTRLLLLLEAIKGSNPCYKRDTLIEVLNSLMISDELLLDSILCNPFKQGCRIAPWKELANAIAVLPDLLANCCALDKFPAFNKQEFYRFLTTKLYASMEHLSLQQRSILTEDHKMFLLQLLGRIAISGQSQLVWKKFTSKAIREERSELKQLISSIFVLAACSDSSHKSLTFEIFIDHLYMPIFFNLKPSKRSGDIIRSLIGEVVLNNDHFEYIICDKSIFKTYYNLNRRLQSIFLYNTFAYLSSIVNHRKYRSPIGEDNCSLLMKTLLEILRSWSNSTKVLLRVYEHNRYVTCALLVAFKYALEYDHYALAKYSSEIMSIIARAIPIYLNRASYEQRNLAMCLGELLLPKLDELIKEKFGNTSEHGNKDIDLKFDADYSDDLFQLQKLFRQDIGELFSDFGDDEDDDNNRETPLHMAQTATSKNSRQINSSISDKSRQSLCTLKENDGKQGEKKEQQFEWQRKSSNENNRGISSKKLFVIELDNDKNSTDTNVEVKEKDDDDLKPYLLKDNDVNNIENDEDGDEIDTVGGDDSMSVPIYLGDCINGLIENNSARYVRLCLVKASELIGQMLEYEASQNEKSIDFYKQRLSNPLVQHHRQQFKKTNISDTIRDVAVELAQVLFYLDNQFSIKNFDAYRMKALILLSIAVPDLVVKYLLEEFNGSNKSLGHQLEILHILVASARYLSGESALDNIHLVDNGAVSKAGHLKNNLRTSEAIVDGKNSNDTSKSRGGKINKFAKYASLYFYGIVYRLKADFNASGSIIISQPKTIVSAAKEQRCIDDGRRLIVKKGVQQGREKEEFKGDSDWDDNNLSNDDSYLLSRILFSISLLINCLNQQPITCKLSSGLIDILTAYRFHPDPGVHKAIISCLKVIKDSTPSVYFASNIEERMMHLFGPWLTNEL